jgi:hypothetical protein
MTNREYVKTQVDTLPENVIEKLQEFIAFQKFSLGLFDILRHPINYHFI